MKKVIFSFIALMLIFSQFLPSGVLAYSYGDPNEEKVAEVYKEMLLKLDDNPPNFTDAKSLYLTVKEEIDMHMGPEPSTIILENIEQKDKEKLVESMEKLLALNIARRLENIENKFAEYDNSKKLLAKAFATYSALSPKIEAEKPEVDKQLKSEFDQALSSLGNPGLFGVGKKESNFEEFKSSKQVIFSLLQTEFKMEGLDVGHFSTSVEELGKIEKKDWTDISNFRNWIPIILIFGLLIGIVIYTLKKRKG
jgi:hypothetical protein